MKQYVIDGLRPKDRQLLESYLEEHFGPAQIKDVYWLPMDPSLYSPTQAAHTDCQPFYFVVVLHPDSIAAEMLVRTQHRVRCDCMGYAGEDQRTWLIRVIDSIFEELMIQA